MKLYYLPGACSLASHILLREAGVDFATSRVANGRAEDGEDFRSVNPLGYVPALAGTEFGTLLENGSILPYLADRFGFVGVRGRYRLLEEIAFLSSELHKAYSPFFRDPELSGAPREAAERHLHSRLDRYEQAFAETDFDAAKAYAFVITGWSPHVGVSLDSYPRIQALRQHLSDRVSVKEALRAEGLS